MQDLQVKFADWLHHSSHRRFGQYFYLHRAGPLGLKAPFIALFVGIKLVSMMYGASRDRAAAIDNAQAYGQGGHMVGPPPK